jgi:hypothetical protein
VLQILYLKDAILSLMLKENKLQLLKDLKIHFNPNLLNSLKPHLEPYSWHIEKLMVVMKMKMLKILLKT